MSSRRVIMVIVALVGTLVRGINGEWSYSRKLFEGGAIGFSDFTEIPTPDVKQFGGIGGFPEIDSPPTDQQSDQHPFGVDFTEIPTPDVKQFGGIGGFPEIDSPPTDQSDQHPFGVDFTPIPDPQRRYGYQHPLGTGDPVTHGWNMIPVDSSSFTSVSG